MENFIKWLIVWVFIWSIVWMLLLQSVSLEKQYTEIAIKTQECYSAWWTEYLHWNGTCQKVIQERKVETILIKK